MSYFTESINFLNTAQFVFKVYLFSCVFHVILLLLYTGLVIYKNKNSIKMSFKINKMSF